jgi:ABC-type phosphate transport system auxiliary subunit
MPQRPSQAVMERDAQSADLYRRGLTYRQIARQLGYRSPQSVGDAIRRHARTTASDSLAGPEALQVMLDRLQDYRRLAWRVATARHYATTASGNVALHPETGQPLLDDAPVLHALDRLLRFDDHEAKLTGLYAPSRSRVEVITEDVIEGEIRKLEAQIGLAKDDTLAE